MAALNPAGDPSSKALHLDRREMLGALGLWGLGFLGMGSSGRALAQGDAPPERAGIAESVIVLWLDGGPSQLDTFDPKPGTAIGGEVKSRKTRVKGVEIASGFEQLADVMDEVSLIRSLSSKEGDHERAQYHLRTGYRMEPTLRHPCLGAVFCHERPDAKVEIPQHIALEANERAPWGGYLGNELDAFRSGDPANPVPDLSSGVRPDRYERRLADLDILEEGFAEGRADRTAKLGHREMVEKARRMMKSAQVEAFDISKESAATRAAYGDQPFGRSVLAARRLVEVGVRWVECRLGGWDSHINNHELQASGVATLDKAFASLIRDLRERDRLDRTLILCLGEFGRTPRINPAGGRDHWPAGFSVALAGGPIRRGVVIGETDPEGGREVKDPQSVQDLAATVLAACGIKPDRELMTPASRPTKLSEGKPIRALLPG